MADKPSLNETKAFLASELKKTLADHTARIEDIRAREAKAVAKRASKLAKAEKTCKGCGKKFDSVGPTQSEYCGGCNRKPKDAEGKVRKNDLMTTPDSGAPTSMGMSEKSMRKDAMAGQAPGGGDMTLSEMCKSCGKSGDLCKCATCKSELGKAAMPFEKGEKCETPGCKNEAKGASGYCPTCLLSGPEPKVLHPSDKKRGKVKKDEKGAAASVANANKELGGFKSLAQHPTAPFKTKPGTVGTAGKSEGLGKKSPPGKFHDLPEKLAREGKSKSSAEAIAWSAYDKSKGKTAKAELPAVKAAPEKKSPKAKLPGMPKKVDATGSGGQVEKGKSMKKAAIDVALGMQKPAAHDPMAIHTMKLPGMGKPMPPPVPKVNGMHPNTAQGLHAVGVGMHPETRASLGALPRPSAVSQGGVGVPGKQPAGMGGGDAHKIAAVPPPIPAAARKDETPMAGPAGKAAAEHPPQVQAAPSGGMASAEAHPPQVPHSLPGKAASFRDRSPAIQAARRLGSVLARGEKSAEKKPTLAVKPTKLQRGLSMTNHNRRLASI